MTGRFLRRGTGACAALAIIFGFAWTGLSGAATGADPSAGEFRAATAADIVGKTFISKVIKREDVPPGTRFRVSFSRKNDTVVIGRWKATGKGFSATAGCNDFSGAIRIRKGELKLKFAFMTQVYCSGLVEVEDRYFSFFEKKRSRVFYRDGELEFRRDGHRIRLAEMRQAESAPSLEGTSWKFRSTSGPQGVTAGPAPRGRAPKLSFGGGRYKLKSPCTAEEGASAIGDGIMIFDAASGRWGFCGRADRRREFRQRLGLLRGVVDYELKDNGNLVFDVGRFKLVFMPVSRQSSTGA